MTGGPVRPALRARIRERAGRAAARFETTRRRVAELPGVATAVRAFKRYNEAGGGLVSRGLAFAILFAIVPAILLVSSLAALLIGDPGSRAGILAALAQQFPPLEPILTATVDSAVAVAPATSVISSLVLLWSASGMVRALDVAVGLAFREHAIPRSPLRLVGLVLAVGAGLLVVTVILVVTTISGPVSDLIGIGPNARLTALGVLAAVVVSAYRFLPRARPGWLVALVPGLVVALVLGLFSVGFALLSPVLVGSVQVFGALAVVFLGIVWLGFSTDVFLIGAAWTAIRSEDAAVERARRIRVVAEAAVVDSAHDEPAVADGDLPG